MKVLFFVYGLQYTNNKDIKSGLSRTGLLPESEINAFINIYSRMF